MRHGTNMRYIAVLVWIAAVFSIIIHIIGFFLLALTCEMVGLQTSNLACQLYFTVGSDINSNLSFKGWCLYHNDGHKSGRGFRCLPSNRLLGWLDDVDHTKLDKLEHTIKKNGKEAKAENKSSTSKTTLSPRPSVSSPPSVIKNTDMKRFMEKNNIKEDMVKPKTWISQGREKVDIVISVSSFVVTRNSRSLLETVDSLIVGLHPEDQHNCLIIIFITQLFGETLVAVLTEQLKVRYQVHIATGLLEIVVPDQTFYINLYKEYKFKKSFNQRLGIKRCLDKMFVLLIACQRGKFYLPLNTDVVIPMNYYGSIREVMAKYKELPWMSISLSAVKQNGRLMKIEQTSQLLQVLYKTDGKTSVDSLIDNFIVEKICSNLIDADNCNSVVSRLTPTEDPFLFKPKHQAKELDASTTSGKVHIPWLPKLTTKVIPGYLPCSTLRTRSDILPMIASGKWPFQLQNVRTGGRLEIMFNRSVTVTKLKIETGLPEHFATSSGESSSVWVYSTKEKMFKKIGQLTAAHDLSVSLPKHLQEMSVLLINFDSPVQTTDMFLSKLILTCECSAVTTLATSGTAIIKNVSLPQGYRQHSVTPRLEDGVLISH